MSVRTRSHTRSSQHLSSTRKPGVHYRWPWGHKMEIQTMEVLQGWMVPTHDSQPSAISLPTQSSTTSSRPAWVLKMELITCTQQHLGTYIPLGRSHSPRIQQRQRSRRSPEIYQYDWEWPKLLSEPCHSPIERIHRQRNLDNQEQKPIPPYSG